MALLAHPVELYHRHCHQQNSYEQMLSGEIYSSVNKESGYNSEGERQVTGMGWDCLYWSLDSMESVFEV